MRSPGVAAYDEAALARCAALLIEGARELAGLGWTPATSSNFSMRLDAGHVAITCSGADKGRLIEEDILVVDLLGRPVGRNGGRAPSAETALHAQLYARLPDVGCVLHTHSRTQTVASRLYASAGRVVLEGYELQKAFRGTTSHAGVVTVPVVANDQDMAALSARVARALDDGAQWGYLIAGHGLYAWGRDLSEARRHLEAFDFLLGCELETRRLSP